LRWNDDVLHFVLIHQPSCPLKNVTPADSKQGRASNPGVEIAKTLSHYFFVGSLSFLPRLCHHGFLWGALMKPLKRVVCWIIGHKWLPSHYDMAHFRGGRWECGRCGKSAFGLKQ
jgi:hypothetical protein